MKVVYIAGPYRGPDAWAIECNIRRAEALALEVWRLGVAVICPHANTRFFQGAAPDNVWLDGDLELLRRCDAVLFTPDWRNSTGARAEHDEAMRRGIECLYDLIDLRAWLAELGEPAKPRTCGKCGFDEASQLHWPGSENDGYHPFEAAA